MGQRIQPQEFQNVLGWSSPFDMVCKLESELERIDDAETLRDVVEHTMNFALTAYHITEWVWNLLKRKPTPESEKFERASWISVIGHEPQTKKEMRDWVLKHCPEIEYCRQLANATKHLSCCMKEGVSAAEIEVAATDEWEKRTAEEPFVSILDQHRAENWQLILVDAGKRLDVIEIFRDRVFEFWSDLTYRIYIGGDNYDY